MTSAAGLSSAEQRAHCRTPPAEKNAGGAIPPTETGSRLSRALRSHARPPGRAGERHVQASSVQGREENEHMALEITPLDKVASRTSRALRPEARAPYLFLLPFVALFTLFFIVPILYALYQS